jgi:hypothetical protein
LHAQIEKLLADEVTWEIGHAKAQIRQGKWDRYLLGLRDAIDDRVDEWGPDG